MYTLHRKKYEDAKAQLLKGEKMFENLTNLTNLPGWSYRGLVCFTEIENREVFTSELEDLSEDEIKVSVCVSKVNKSIVHYIVDSDKRGTEGRK